MKIEIIIERLKNWDSKVYKLIYELYYKSTFHAAFFITKDAGLAEDATHEAFLKLRDKIDQLEDPSKLETWLCRMAANIARDIIRQRSKSTLFAETREIYSEDQVTSPEKTLLDNEEKQIIREIINHLQPEHKRVMYLRYFEDLSVDEIGNILGIPVGTVKSRLFYAREEFKKLIKPDGHFGHHGVDTDRLKEVK